MIVMDIIKLSVISRETTEQEVEELNLIERLKEATKTSKIKGYGLSAIQVGEPVRFAWFTFKEKQYTLLNPEIISAYAPNIHKDEGCMSLKGIRVNVERYYNIEYITNGKKKKAKGLLAFIIQHEIDHMNGILIIDRGGKSE